MRKSAWLRRLALIGAGTVLTACPSDDAGVGPEDSSSSTGDGPTTDAPTTASTTVGPSTSSSSSGDTDTGTSSSGDPETSMTTVSASLTEGTQSASATLTTGEPTDTGTTDTGTTESSTTDTGTTDTGTTDTGTTSATASSTESSTTDTGADAVCMEFTINCAAPADDCVCVGCNDDGVCEQDDDCVCSDCDDTEYCLPSDCNGDGVCDPFFEGCACTDCYPHPECADNPMPCGDGMIDAFEDCDGDDLGGQDCVGLGFTGGTLSCSTMCTYDRTECTVPDEWTCDPLIYGEGLCDCGCGVVDLDCADATVASCVFCNDEGSCGEAGGACPGDIDPLDNAHCS